MKNLIEKLKEIEKLVCENFEDLEIDDPAEDGIYDDYLLVGGATDEQIEKLEAKFDVRMPEDVKELYRYKNGSKGFYLLFPNDKYDRMFPYRLLSLAEIEETKGYFQNKDVMLTEVYSADDDDERALLKRMEDHRVRPYLFHRKWIPFAEAPGGVRLLLDFDPDEEGTYGQILCYIHDPDEIAYAAKTITEMMDDTIGNVTVDDVSYDK